MTVPSSDAVKKWSVMELKDTFKSSADIQIYEHFFDEEETSSVLFIYCDGTCDTKEINQTVLPELQEAFVRNNYTFAINDKTLMASLPFNPLGHKISEDMLSELLFGGTLVLFVPEASQFFSLSISKLPERTPEESNTEISIKGPKDGFVESIVVNVALIRKRIRSNSLSYESFTIGTRSRTKVGLLYMQDIISPTVLKKIQTKLSKIDVDAIYGIGQMEDLIVERKYSLFPLLEFTGRPDYAMNCLMNGRFVIVIDGSPMVLIGPATFLLLLKSPEDLHFNIFYVSMVRIIRFISFALSVFLPGFWVALTSYHPDQVPYRLLATISLARSGIPFPSQLEMFLLLLLLEIFREAGVRMPSSIGQTLTVIGGLIIGDAAIRAGLVSPSVVVVGAITAVSASTLVNQSVASSSAVVRVILLTIASFLGMYGLILALILLIIYMSSLKSFTVPYLSPLSPPVLKDIIPGVFRVPWQKTNQRPEELHTQDKDHMEKEKE